MTAPLWRVRWTFGPKRPGQRSVRPRIAFDCFRQRPVIRSVWMERDGSAPSLTVWLEEDDLAAFMDEIYEWFDPRTVRCGAQRLHGTMNPAVARVRSLGTAVALEYRPLGAVRRPSVPYRTLVHDLGHGRVPARWKDRDRADATLRPGFLPAIAAHAYDLLQLETL